jgi:inorganic triphosphatase YgiF
MSTLAGLDRLGVFVVRRRRRELQRNSFFDNANRGLGRAKLGFRRRSVAGKALSTWTIKGESGLAPVPGIAMRSEIELELDEHTPPALALGALRQAAEQRGARVLAEQIGDALVIGGAPPAAPYLETETDRRIADLAADEHGWLVELALDDVRLVDHQYEEREIEAELKRGDLAALAEARRAIEALGEVHESRGSKLSRALAHLATCECT